MGEVRRMKKLIHKKPHWEVLLFSWIEENRKSCSFSRDQFDCVRRTADLVQAYTGYDLAEPFRNSYRTDFEAFKLLASKGGTMEILVASHFKKCGLFEIPLRKATLGDLVFFKLNKLGSITVCLGGSCIVQGDTQLDLINTLDGKRAWRIPA
jgi:hypothetical protein